MTARLAAVILTLPVAGLAVTAELVGAWAVFLLWGGALLFLRRGRREPVEEWRRPAVRWSVGTAAAVVIVALLAPKRIDRLKAMSLTLAKTDYTIRELDDELASRDSSALPVLIFLPEGPAAYSLGVRFPLRTPTVGQFIETLERQRGFRHSLSGCGNAYSILAGPAYGFGLSFGPPPGELSEPSWRGEWVGPPAADRTTGAARP